MTNRKISIIQVQNTLINIINMNQDDYINITDMAKAKQTLPGQQISLRIGFATEVP